jgi:2-keto-4-pentenoate hydratase/2-oxohepta-3-ene-1,7-dioic acid hydratase in catechol pathway
MTVELPIGKIVCVGRNYREHAKELGNAVPTEPLLFIKPRSSIIRNNGVIMLPPESERVEHEAELALLIGRKAHRIVADEAAEHIAGYGCANDVTARDLQKKDGQFTRAKGFDTFCAIGDWTARAPAPSARVRLTVNGELRQDGRLADMVFTPPVLIAFISTIMTLEPGDVVLTGTPHGVGPLREGDVVRVSIDDLSDLQNTVQLVSVDPARTSAGVLQSKAP